MKDNKTIFPGWHTVGWERRQSSYALANDSCAFVSCGMENVVCYASDFRIDEESPFWKMSPKDILSTNFEIIVTLDSVIESTGNTTQARSSYLPNEILWGFRWDR